MGSLATWGIGLLVLTQSPQGDGLVSSRERRGISADPDAPSFRYGWLRGWRGRASTPIDLWGTADAPGFGVWLVPMVELHNEIDSPLPVPNELWRGRAGLEFSYAVSAPASGVHWALTLAIEHESDHRSVEAQGPFFFGSGEPLALTIGEPSRLPAYLYEDDLALRLDLDWKPGALRWYATTWHRLHFATCTRRVPDCELVQFGSGTHEWSQELGAELDLDLLRLALAGFVSRTLPANWIAEEHRLVLQLTGRWRVGDGELLVALVAQRGDVGYQREDQRLLYGAFLGWVP